MLRELFQFVSFRKEFIQKLVTERQGHFVHIEDEIVEHKCWWKVLDERRAAYPRVVFLKFLF
jgi:hypothetical protein